MLVCLGNALTVCVHSRTINTVDVDGVGLFCLWTVFFRNRTKPASCLIFKLAFLDLLVPPVNKSVTILGVADQGWELVTDSFNRVLVVVVFTLEHSLHSTSLRLTSVSHVHPPSSVVRAKLSTCLVNFNLLRQDSALLVLGNFTTLVRSLFIRDGTGLDTVLRFVNDRANQFPFSLLVQSALCVTERVNRLAAYCHSIGVRVKRSLSGLERVVNAQVVVLDLRIVFVQSSVIKSVTNLGAHDKVLRIDRCVLVANLNSLSTVHRINKATTSSNFFSGLLTSNTVGDTLFGS